MFFCRLFEENKAFTILESILGGSMALFIAVIIFTLLGSYFTLCERAVSWIELTENLITAEQALFHFSRYSSTVEVLPGGRGVRFRFPQNSIDVYALEGTLLIQNKGVSNPLAQGCGQEVIFRIEKLPDSRAMVLVSIPFFYGKREEVLNLQMGTGFWKK
ncbi:MAG: hypothetical protein ACUVQZ_05055 [Candidatus Caldatribacteriaceae bacterium]